MSLLAQLIADHETEAQQAAAQLQQDRQKALDELTASLEKAFGPLADEMAAELESVAWARDNERVVVEAAFKIQHQDWKESGYFRYALYRGGYSSPSWRLSSGPHIHFGSGVALTGAITPDVIAFLADGQKQHEQRLVKNREEAEQRRNTAIEEAYRWISFASREEAAQYLNKLRELSPEREEKWRKAYEARIAELDQAEVAAEERKAALKQYRQALENWYALEKRILDANRAKALAIQEEFDREFTVWTLMYGASAPGEDGEWEHWFESVRVLSNEPDKDGYWPVLRYGKVERKKFYHLVALGEPETCRPTEYTSLACNRTPPDSNHTTIYFLEEDEAAVMERLAELESMPPKPRANEYGLSSFDWDVQQVEMAVLNEEIPF